MHILCTIACVVALIVFLLVLQQCVWDVCHIVVGHVIAPHLMM